MGFTPNQVDDMTIYQFSAAVEGYRAAHSEPGAVKNAFTDEELKLFGIVDDGN